MATCVVNHYYYYYYKLVTVSVFLVKRTNLKNLLSLQRNDVENRFCLIFYFYFYFVTTYIMIVIIIIIIS